MFKHLLPLLGERAVQMIATLLGTILLARHLSPAEFGHYQYAVGLTTMMMVVVGMGLAPVVKRRVLRESGTCSRMIYQATALRLGCGLLLYTIIIAAASLSRNETDWVLVIVSFALFREVLVVVDLWFQVNQRYIYPAGASIAAAIFGFVLKCWGVVSGKEILFFAYAYVFEVLLFGGLLWFFYRIQSGDWPLGNISLKRMRLLLAESWPVWISGLSVVIYMRIDLVMLKMMVDDEQVAYFACASRLTEVSFVLPNILAMLVFPLLRIHENDQRRLSRFMEGYISASFYMACGLGVLYSVFAVGLIPVVFGNSYSASIHSFVVLLISLPIVSLGVARGQYLTFWGRLKPLLPISISGALLNVLLNWLLIPYYGIVGAAWASVASQLYTSILSGILFSSLFQIFSAQIAAPFRFGAILYFLSNLSHSTEEENLQSGKLE